MSWNPLLEAGSPDAVAIDAIETLIVAARGRPWRISRCAAPFPRRSGRWSVRSSSSTTSGRRRSPPGREPTCVPTPISGSRPSPISFAARSCIATAWGRNRSSGRATSTGWWRGAALPIPSERPLRSRKKPHSGYGLQTWVALPDADEDTAPSFEHHAKAALPVIEGEGARLRLILGRAYGEAAPARVFSETFYADAELEAGARIPLPDDHEERGLYILEGSISVAGQSFEAGQMMVFRPKDQISVAAGPSGARLILLGGATLAGPRYIWWNFVASSREKIDAAKEQWRKGDWGRGQFDLPPDDRDEFIPLPA